MLPAGVKMLINSGTPHVLALLNEYRADFIVVPALGEFYAQDMGTGNLEMLSRFFEKYPEYADRTFLSVKVRIRHIIECVGQIAYAISP